jgi:hypothetical protein
MSAEKRGGSMFNQEDSMFNQKAVYETDRTWAAFVYAWRPVSTRFAYKGRPAARPAEPPKTSAPPKPAQQPATGAPEPSGPKPAEPAKKGH